MQTVKWTSGTSPRVAGEESMERDTVTGHVPLTSPEEGGPPQPGEEVN